jgi:4-amino-4-deoxy-L-arabinose transferase-like glycosyltransferase
MRLKQLSIVRYPISLGLGLVLATRLMYVFLVPNPVEESWRDGRSYDNIARNIISGVGYWDTTGEWPGEPPYADPSVPTTFWPPGYPFFIAAIYFVFGEKYRAVYFTQAILGLGIGVFVYVIGKSLLGKREATLAMFLYAVDPFAITISGYLQNETLFTFLVVATIYCFIKMADDTKIRLRLVSLFAVFAGLATLTRSIAGMMFAGLIVGILFRLDNREIRLGTRLFMIAVASVIFVGTLVPWVLRNHRLTAQYFFSAQDWITLAIANNDYGGVYATPQALAARPETSIEQSETERQAVYKRFVKDWVAANPERFAKFFVWRAAAFWSPFLHYVTGVLAIIGGGFNMIVFLFAATYMIAYRKQWRKFFSIYTAFLTFTVGYSLAYVATRFRLPLYPLIEILAAGGMLMILERYSLFAKRNLWPSLRVQSSDRSSRSDALCTVGD